MTVLIEDAEGNLVNSTASVTLALKSAGSDTAAGTPAVTAVAGTATFSDVYLSGTKTETSGSYLDATSSGLTAAKSTTFAVTN